MKIIFRKSGNFYSVYDEDAFIIHNLFHYKIKDDRVGFPINSIEKVTEKLNELHINYFLEKEDFLFDDNKYEDYLIESKNKIYLDQKIAIINQKIQKANFNQLNELIEIIDRFFYEK